MKKFVLLLALLPFVSFAQSDYRPLVEKGKEWTYRCKDLVYEFDYRYTLEGDTAVAGKNCLKMYSDNKYNKGEICYEGALFEENKKVYCFYPDKNEASLLYDFDCEAGDTVKSMVVKEISTDTIATEVKRYIFEPYLISDDGEKLNVLLGNASWIEGVGAEKDFFDMLPMAGNYNSLVSCEVNGEILFKLPPLPPSGINPVERDFMSDDVIYDLQGRRLRSIPKRGIYIQNGKKRIAY